MDENIDEPAMEKMHDHKELVDEEVAHDENIGPILLHQNLC